MQAFQVQKESPYCNTDAKGIAKTVLTDANVKKKHTTNGHWTSIIGTGTHVKSAPCQGGDVLSLSSDFSQAQCLQVLLDYLLLMHVREGLKLSIEQFFFSLVLGVFLEGGFYYLSVYFDSCSDFLLSRTFLLLYFLSFHCLSIR